MSLPTNYLDLLPQDVSEIIYKKKFHLELLDGLIDFKNLGGGKVKIPQKTNYEIGEMVNVSPDKKTRRGDYSYNSFKGIIERITPKYYYLRNLSLIDQTHLVRYEKKYISRYTPDMVKIKEHSKRYYHYDEGSVWYISNPSREKYSEYLNDRWVDWITELRVGGTPVVSMNNPYLTLYLEVSRPELGIVWDRKSHPNFRG